MAFIWTFADNDFTLFDVINKCISIIGMGKYGIADIRCWQNQNDSKTDNSQIEVVFRVLLFFRVLFAIVLNEW